MIAPATVPAAAFAAGALAAAETFPFVSELVVVFAVGTVLTWICHRLHVVSIVGFLVAGVLIGPNALALVENRELIDAMAEVGVILLLFTIGVEFSLKKLALIRRFILLGGGLQVGLTTLLSAVAMVALGAGWGIGIYTGFLVALSSTAIVLKLLSMSGRTNTPAGRISLGVLVFQDLAVVAMVLLIPALAGGDRSAVQVLRALGGAVGIIAVVLLLALRAVPPLLERVAHARSPELFLLTVVVVCFGIAWLTSAGGASLSLGAFLAGLVVSNSRFREHAVGEILPLRTLFNAVFFVSVGMLLDLSFVVANLPLVLGVAMAVFLGKAAITGLAVVALRYPLRLAAAVALSLAQIGEFSFVLEGVGREAGLSPGGLGEQGRQTFLAVTVLLMAATPFVSRWGERTARRAREEGPLDPAGRSDAPAGGIPESGHVVVGGFGMAGRAIQRSLATLRIPHVVVDLNPVSVIEAEAMGIPAEYGDLSNASILEKVHAHTARLVVVAINDAEATKRICQRIKLVHPEIEVVARVPYGVDADVLDEIGVDVVVVEEVESAVHLIEETLWGCDIATEEVAIQVARFRSLFDVT